MKQPWIENEEKLQMTKNWIAKLVVVTLIISSLTACAGKGAGSSTSTADQSVQQAANAVAENAEPSMKHWKRLPDLILPKVPKISASPSTRQSGKLRLRRSTASLVSRQTASIFWAPTPAAIITTVR